MRKYRNHKIIKHIHCSFGSCNVVLGKFFKLYSLVLVFKLLVPKSLSLCYRQKSGPHVLTAVSCHVFLKAFLKRCSGDCHKRI